MVITKEEYEKVIKDKDWRLIELQQEINLLEMQLKECYSEIKRLRKKKTQESE